MPKLFAVAAILIGGVWAVPAHKLDASPMIQAQVSPAADQQPDTDRNAWFGTAIEHLLDDGSDSAAPKSPAPKP